MQAAEELKAKVPERRHYHAETRFDENGVPTTNLSGTLTLALSRLLAPSPEKTRQILLELRREFGLSRPMMAAHLCVAESTLKSWEKGTRTPGHIARRCIWMVNLIAHGSMPQSLPFWNEAHSCEGEH